MNNINGRQRARERPNNYKKSPTEVELALSKIK